MREFKISEMIVIVTVDGYPMADKIARDSLDDDIFVKFEDDEGGLEGER